MNATAVTMPITASGLILATLRVVLFCIWTVSCVTILIALRVFGLNPSPARLRLFRILCWIFGMHVVVHGHPANDRPLLIASNHISYLDIIAFGTVTELEFVSKAEVADWPFFGFLAKLGGTVFIDRRRTRTVEARDGISERLAAKRRLVLFPEATSGDGNCLLPFKSALFTAAESVPDGTAVAVQPAAIAYTRLNGLPTGFGWRSFFAWYGDMTLASHMWRFLQLGRTTVEIIFLEPILSQGQFDRKALAAASEQASQAGFNRLLSGRVRL